MVSNFAASGIQLTVDRFYTSPGLSLELLKMNITLQGTIKICYLSRYFKDNNLDLSEILKNTGPFSRKNRVFSSLIGVSKSKSLTVMTYHDKDKKKPTLFLNLILLMTVLLSFTKSAL